MKQYDVVMSSKGQFVLPKEVREKFKLTTGSRIQVVVDGEQIILKPRTAADEFKDLLLADILRDGREVSAETLREYQTAFNKTVDSLVMEAEEEYKSKQYVTIADLKRSKKKV